MIDFSQDETMQATASEADFDDLMASLFVLVTHHSLTQSESALESIVDRLHKISHHSEIDLYPNQQKVINKMQHLWRTRLFNMQLKSIKH